MKQRLISIFFVLVSKSLFAQFEVSEFDFDRVTGVDSIVVNISSDSSSWKEVFYYEGARRTRANYFDDVDYFSHYRLFHHNNRKQLSSESYHGKSSMFDSDKDDWIEFWDSTRYDLTIKRFLGPKLLERIECRVFQPDTIVNQITTYTYDTKQRILSEITRDVFTGIVGFYKSNAVELREMKQKTEVITYSRTYSYEPRKVHISYKVNDKLTGEEMVGLDGKGQVTSIKQYSSANILLSETTASYDEKGRLKSKTWKTHSSISIWGQETDVISDGTETTEYDNLGRPSAQLIVYTGDYKTTTRYRYY